MKVFCEKGKVIFDDFKDVFSEDELKFIVGFFRREGWVNVRKEDGKLVFEIIEKGREVLERFIDKVLKFFVERGEVLVKEIEKFVFVNEFKRRKIGEEDVIIERVVEIIEKGEEFVKKGFEFKKEVLVFIFEFIKFGKWREVEFRKFDIKVLVRRIYLGKK